MRVWFPQLIQCDLFQPNYWSTKRNEVIGTITDEKGNEVRKLFGKWNEALYCGVPPSAKCIWRPGKNYHGLIFYVCIIMSCQSQKRSVLNFSLIGTMPENYEMYYGFTRFAIELNELDSETTKYLPKTDTRFRPDQR